MSKHAQTTGTTFSGPVAMGNNKITGLAAATANGDALRYEDLLLPYAIGRRVSGSQVFFNPGVVTFPEEVDPYGMLSSNTFTLSAGIWLATAQVYSTGSPAGTLTFQLSGTGELARTDWVGTVSELTTAFTTLGNSDLTLEANPGVQAEITVVRVMVVRLTPRL